MPFAATLFAAALSLATAAPGAVPTSQGMPPHDAGSVPAVEYVLPGDGSTDHRPSAADRLRAGAATGALLTMGLQEAAELRTSPDAPALQEIRSRGAVPLMAAGGALFIAGLLIGDDLGTLLAVGGAVVGSYGVYLYF